MVDATGVWIRVRRAQRTRRGEEDGVDGYERVVSNLSGTWVTALDVGEMWEICTGPRNLAGASDFDMYEYKKASGELDEEEEEESPPGSMT